MLDRTKQMSTAVGLRRLETCEPFMPIRYVPAGGGRPRRLIWMDVEGIRFDHAFLGADIVANEPARSWFVTSLDAVFRVPDVRRTSVPVGGVIFHVARCGSTLARRLLGSIDGHRVLSEPGILNQSLLESTTDSLGPMMRCALAAGADPGGRGYVKTTAWNVLHADQVLDGLGRPSAIFLHREPGAVLAATHESNERSMPTGGDAVRRRRDLDRRHAVNAHYLEAMMSAALSLVEAGRLKCVSYETLVDRMIDGDLPAYFGFEADSEARKRLRRCAERNSKNPDRSYEGDTDRKNAYLDRHPSLAAARDRLKPLHDALERHS